MDSILEYVKTQIPVNGNDFDDELIGCINPSFATLAQLGLGPSNGFSIKDSTSVWGDFVDEGYLQEFVKTYIADKAKRKFDPPQNSFLLKALDDEISELEYRISESVILLEEGC